MRSRSGLARALALLCALGCVLPAGASAADIIVRRDAGLSAAERADLRADAGVKFERRLSLPHSELVTVPDARETRALTALNADPDVRYAAANVRLHVAASAPMDPFFHLQWALGQAPNDADLDLDRAWEFSEGSGVNVAVVDQQVDVAHEDLVGNIEPGGADFVHGEAACIPSTPLAGDDDHGTHVAGTIAAVRDNGKGIAGVAPLAHVVPLRAIDDCGGADLEWILSAFRYAAGTIQAPIVSASFATHPLDAKYREYNNEAFANLFEEFASTLFVVAAGNEGVDLDAEHLPVYPCSTLTAAGTDPPNVVCVGMSDSEDRPSCFGNVGGGSVDLFAPGMNVFSSVRTNKYLSRNGTSPATAMVAGVAALLKAYDSASAGSDLKRALLGSVDPVAGMEAISASMGRLNAARALGDLGRLGSGGSGLSEPWVSCDRDHDGAYLGHDHCPDAPARDRADGCPDGDGDGVRDRDDNCAAVRNGDQADADSDRRGDACDTTPRGDDVDGDLKGALDDRCPTLAASTADGCPVVDPPLPVKPNPTVTPGPSPGTAPRIVSLEAKATRRRCRTGRSCPRAAKVTVRVSRTATVGLKVERRVRKRGRPAWERVISRSLTATASGRSVTIRGKRGRGLRKGAHRVTATLGAARAAARFTV